MRRVIRALHSKFGGLRSEIDIIVEIWTEDHTKKPDLSKTGLMAEDETDSV